MKEIKSAISTTMEKNKNYTGEKKSGFYSDRMEKRFQNVDFDIPTLK